MEPAVTAKTQSGVKRPFNPLSMIQRFKSVRVARFFIGSALVGVQSRALRSAFAVAPLPRTTGLSQAFSAFRGIFREGKRNSRA